MAYEYSGQGSRFDFPNPFYAENWFLAAACAISLAGAATLLVLSRHSLASSHSVQSWLPLLLGLGLLIMGLRFGQRLLMQLRFFFGRGEPAGLAPELDQDKTGRSEQSEHLKKELRQNALEYAEPTGPLNGLLYSTLRGLIYAPAQVQHTAQRQFQTAIAVLVTLISFLVAWIGFTDARQAAWMGLFYFLFSVFLLVRPLDYQSHAKVGMGSLIVLILVAIFAPVLLPLGAAHLPDITWLSLNVQTLFLLLMSLLAVGLYFLALVAQMNPPPATDMARETATLSINCHPKQLLDEVDRDLQNAWTERIPNRRYSRILPIINAEAGPFAAELIEETQPMPASRERIGLGAALALPRFRWIALLEALGVAMVLLGVLWLALFGARFDPATHERHLFSMLTLGIAMLTLSHYCLKVGHALWARIDFISRVVWIEMEGNYQTAQVNLGNDFTSQMKTAKRITNIETMTLRVWAAELDSVIFGKHGANGRPSVRQVYGLRGAPDYARPTLAHLVEFAQQQSVIVAPTSAADLQKSKILGAVNQLAGQATAAVSPQLAAAAGVAPAATAAAAAPRFCGQCGGKLTPGDRFCGGCGAPVTA